jgi:hypothetical protein
MSRKSKTGSLFGGDEFHGAVLDGCYRYALWRHDDTQIPPRIVNFLMLNPSTADAVDDDNTIRRCIGFARRWDFRGFIVTNLFALRSRHPRELIGASDPVGPKNDEMILKYAKQSSMVICAWGSHQSIRKSVAVRSATVLGMLLDASIPLYHLGLCGDGNPRHPLFLESATDPIAWTARRG